MVGGMDADIRGQKYPQGVRASGTGWHQLKKLLEPDSEPDEYGVEAGLTPRQRELLSPSKEVAEAGGVPAGYWGRRVGRRPRRSSSAHQKRQRLWPR